MKKMTKGAIVTGLGVALLLGGGGTLAVWNTSATADAGTITAGDLNLEAGDGVWTDAQGTPVDVENYLIVPGTTLTYTQELQVTLEGDGLRATLETDGASANNGFTEENVDVSEVTLTGSDGHAIPKTGIVESDTVTAQTTFEFKESTDGRDSVNAQYNFSDIRYVLDQQIL